MNYSNMEWSDIKFRALIETTLVWVISNGLTSTGLTSTEVISIEVISIEVILIEVVSIGEIGRQHGIVFL